MVNVVRYEDSEGRRSWVRITLPHRGYSQTGLGPNNLSPATWSVEIWVCEQGITLKLAWGPSNSSPKKSCEVFLVFISACLDFPDHFFFLFPARNSLLVLLFPTFGIFLTFHQR